jgi:hypothetical protein
MRLSFVATVSLAFVVAVASASCGGFKTIDNASDASTEPAGDAGPSWVDGGRPLPVPAVDGSVDATTNADAAPVCDAGMLTSDPLNCGSCGHSCLGGACNDKMCQPVRVATSDGGDISSVAVSATHVFWMMMDSADSSSDSRVGSLYSCKKTDFNCTPTVVYGKKQLGKVVGDGATAYATFVFGDRALLRLEPGGPVLLSNATDRSLLYSMAVRDTDVYVSNHVTANGKQGREISRFGINAAGVSLSPFSATDSDGVSINTRSFAVTPSAIFLGSNSHRYIATCALPACASWSPFAEGANFARVFSIATDDSKVFWNSDEQGGSVYSCPVGASCTNPTDAFPSRVLANSHPLFLTIQSGQLFASMSNGAVVSCTTTDCYGTAKVIAQETRLIRNPGLVLDGPTIAADSAAVYYAAFDEGTTGSSWRMMRLAR